MLWKLLCRHILVNAPTTGHRLPPATWRGDWSGGGKSDHCLTSFWPTFLSAQVSLAWSLLLSCHRRHWRFPWSGQPCHPPGIYILIRWICTKCPQVEEVEGQVVVKADKRDLLRGRRAPAVLQVNEHQEWRFCVSDQSLILLIFTIVANFPVSGGGEWGWGGNGGYWRRSRRTHCSWDSQVHITVSNITFNGSSSRKEGFRGPISLVCKEPHLPYDRPKLSKSLGVRRSGHYKGHTTNNSSVILLS